MPSSDAGRTPVQIVSGFLGAGKTTLIRRLVAAPAFAGSLLLVNEIGEIGLDQDVLAEQAETTPILLQNGCVCCVLNDDLGLALRDAALARADGAIAPFRRVIIETTGLADPGPILKRLLADRWLMQRFSLAPVVTVVGATGDAAVVAAEPEATAQLAYADIVAISKGDLAGTEQTAQVSAMIAAANPDARILDIAGDCLDPQAFLVPRLDPVSLASLTVRDHAHPLPIHTAALRFETRPSWSALAAALDGALRRAGRDVLRVKGIVGVAERDAPIVIDAVQTVFHPPLPLRSWPGESRSSRIVAIGRSETVSRLLDDVAASLGIGGEAPSEGPR